MIQWDSRDEETLPAPNMDKKGIIERATQIQQVQVQAQSKICLCNHFRRINQSKANKQSLRWM